MAWNRRSFLKGLASVPPLLGASAPQAAARDVYKELGIRPILNAAGTYTTLSASLMPREVVEAIESASRRFVNLVELQEAAGRKIAAIAGCEAAIVTAGAASALTLGTAACIAGKDREKIRRLPDTEGMRNEVLLQKAHRNGYDHAVRNAGARIVEVETPAEVERAAGARTAMMLFFNVHGPAGRIKVEEWVDLGKRLRVPTMVDAAADLPPVENLSRFHTLGYDLVAFSGGKGLRGPQCAGLLLGRKELIEAAALNHNPNTDSVGRTNKVGKEEIVGMWAALDHYVKQDPKALWREWERRCKAVADLVGAVPGVKAEVFVPEIANAVPHLRLTWDSAGKGLKPSEVVRRLREGEPRIEVRPVIADALEVSVWMLEPGEERVVGERLRDILK